MISRDICAAVLRRAVATGADYAELYAQNTVNHSIHMIADKVDAINDTVVAGASVRVFRGLRCVTASTVDTSEAGLLRCADQAAEALGQGSAQIEIVLKERLFGDIHPVTVVPSSVGNAAKVEILKDGYFAAREYHESIRQVTGTLLDVDHNILVANTDGLYTQDRQIRTRMVLSAVSEINGETQTGTCAPGRRMGLEMFDSIDPKAAGIKAAKQAVTMAGAGYCPADVMPVAIENGFGGVIFHEACGHSLEASSVAYGRSQFAGKLGQQIANTKVTAIDDGTIPNGWGSAEMDDEGTPTARNILIENGVLKSYLVDRLNGRRMGAAITGSARRQDYRYAPTSRMTNTFIANGKSDPAEIIANTEFGLYAKQMGGGSVDPATGSFNFAVLEGYMIRNGKIAEPVRGATLIGKGYEVLRDIDMVGNNLKRAQGMCGSKSGSIPTDVGQPMIRVSSMTVGGRG